MSSFDSLKNHLMFITSSVYTCSSLTNIKLDYWSYLELWNNSSKIAVFSGGDIFLKDFIYL